MHNKNLKYIPYGRHDITEDDVKAVVESLKSDFITQGPLIEKFENHLCKKTKSNFCVATNSATSALHIACLSLGLQAGDNLWTTPITFVASANCARYCGANVDFVDIDPNTGLMSLVELRKKLEKARESGGLPKIVIPVHLGGTCCDMEGLSRLSEEYGFKLIEDASHAIGGKYKNELVGSCKYSSITVFSFHPVKIVTTAEGGAAMTNDPVLHQKMSLHRTHGITKDKSLFVHPKKASWYYEQIDIGFNYRMSDIHAALGISQLARLEKIIAERNKLLDRYKKMLFDLPISFLEIPKEILSSVHLAVIRLNCKCTTKHHQIFEGMRNAGIGVQLHYLPVHLQPYYRSIGFKEGDFPFSEEYSNNAISLPLFPGLTDQEQLRISSTLRDLISQYS